jgi:drug/metabolite transporter (DMT)-like permease
MSESNSRTHLWPGVPLALGSAMLFGAVSPMSKLLLGAIDPLMLAALLYLGAGVGLVVYTLSRSALGHVRSEAPLSRADLPWLSSAIIMGGIIGPILLMFGLSHATASNGSLLLNLEGLATMAIAWVVFRENVDRRLLLGAAAILAGAFVLSWDGHGVKFDTGALLIAAACLAWGIDNNLTRKVSAADPVTIAMLKGLVAGAVNVGLALLSGASIPALPYAVAAGIVGFLGVGVSLVLFVLALRHLGTARTGAYYSLAPFIGAILAVVLLAEPVTAKLVVAAALMGIGLWFHLAERHSHDHEHDALEHNHSHVHDDHHKHAHEGLVTEPHTHWHKHEPLRHSHVHHPDLHHRHRH